MIKFILLAALFTIAAAGHGHYHLGYGFVASGGHGHYGHNNGAVAHVHVKQDPHHYNFDVKEHGPHHNRYHHQSASTNGHGYGYGGNGGGNGGGGGGFGR